MSIATDKSIPTYGEVKTLISNNHNIIIRKLSNYNITPNSSLETVINELNDVNINKDASWFSVSMFGIPDGSGLEDAESAYYTGSFALLGFPIIGQKYSYCEIFQSVIMCNINNKGFTIFSIKYNRKNEMSIFQKRNEQIFSFFASFFLLLFRPLKHQLKADFKPLKQA